MKIRRVHSPKAIETSLWLLIVRGKIKYNDQREDVGGGEVRIRWRQGWKGEDIGVGEGGEARGEGQAGKGEGRRKGYSNAIHRRREKVDILNEP